METATETREQTIDRGLRAMGYTKVRAHFYGGNDEGFVDDVFYYRGEHDVETGGRESTDAEAEIEEALDQEIWDRIGGYDGEPAVDGWAEYLVGSDFISVEGEEQVWRGKTW